MIDGIASLFRQRMEKEIENRIGAARVNISLGTCETHSDYKELCGYIRALSDMVEMMDEVALTLTERK